MPLVRSYRTISPLPCVRRRDGGLFLWHFPSGRPDQPLTGTPALRSPDFPQAAIARYPWSPGALGPRIIPYECTAVREARSDADHPAIEREQRTEQAGPARLPQPGIDVDIHRCRYRRRILVQ